ncbi:MAG TPA: 2-phospho-L-lactate guanylyltransferase [Actinomycetota bacterium]|jgi:2-phospho-L-lactate guanylyltransferase|nr:2-phospho-L-lactate guanylyltransferase [Actinomycetota bacterium]
MRVVVIPVKALAKSKSRLAPELTPLERGALTLAMLEDVLDSTLAVAGWDTWVVSPDEAVLEIAARRGASAIPEEKGPLSQAIRQAEVLAKEREVDALAVVPGDLPLLTADTLTAALHTLGTVVIAPSADRSGTNLLLRRPPRAIQARFGPDSYQRHLALAQTKGLPVSTVERRELAFDLDHPGDILTLLASGRSGRTVDVCRDMDLGQRLTMHA